MLVVPTGNGKSLIYLMLAQLLGARACVLTRTKALQAQLAADFAAMGIHTVQGMNAYLCAALQPGGELVGLVELPGRAAGELVGCDKGPCLAGAKCTLKDGGCEYYDAVARARQSPLVVTNYTFWMHQHARGKGLGKFDLLILDEAHDAPEALSEFLTVSLEPHGAARVGARLLEGEPTIDQWAQWAGHHLPRATFRAEQLAGEIAIAHQTGVRVSRALLDEARYMKGLQSTLLTISRADDSWVARYSSHDRAWLFTPSWPAPWAEQTLFLGIPKVVLTSATVRPKTAEYLGIDPEQLAVQEYPAAFPVSRRPVIHIPTARVRHGMPEGEVRLWLSRIDYILSQRADRKGIIHTVSYDRARFIAQHSKHRDRLILHSSEGTRLAIARFKQQPQDSGAVLISPSVTTGYDFPYTECEFQIITKVPFPDTRDPVAKARTARDPEYGMYATMQALVQSVGRGMRAADDQCETFIVDDQLKWFLWKYKHLAPDWFVRSVQTRSALPAPPARLTDPRKTPGM